MKHMLLPVLSLAAGLTAAQTGQITVDVSHPGHKVSPTFYGLMTEEINHAYDGGLYAELIKNRALKDDPESPISWSLTQTSGTGTVNLKKGDRVPGTELDHFLKLDISTCDPGGRVGVANEGYWGMPVTSNTTYRLSFYARSATSIRNGIKVCLESVDGASVWASANVKGIEGTWNKFKATLRTGNVPASSANRLVLSLSEPGSLELTEVSLFPPTYHNRPNGDRIDLMKMLAELKPTFLRLPGGNYLEGNYIPERFEWKDTLGDIAGRPGHQGPWGYRSTDGLGMLEYLEWCEDLNMQPVLAVYAGYSLRGDHVSPGPDLGPYVQDALDEIEYVSGGTDTKWGAARAKDGHPQPFNLTYVEVGNEDWFDRSGSYDGRFTQFYDAIKKAYPNLQLIATTQVKTRRPDVLDDHYYRNEASMEKDAGHYDSYDRSGPKIFVGEWATTIGRPTPNFGAAIADAAWLTGLERDSDVVVMEAYAPLLVNVNPGAAQWPTNLIGYDALHSFGSPSYWVQSLFAENTGSRVLPTKVEASLPNNVLHADHGGIGVGTYATQSEFKDVKVTSGERTLYAKDFSQGVSDWTLGRGTWKPNGDSLQQTGRVRETHATSGDPSWKSYDYEVKARKISGNEGFLILFHCTDTANYWEWNVGGWGNTATAIQATISGGTETVGGFKQASVETGRWYDVKVHIGDDGIKCYLDGQLISELPAEDVTAAEESPGPIYANATISGSTVYLKVVNVSDQTLPLTINLGSGSYDSRASGWVMTGATEDQNTVADPVRVVPKPIQVEGVSASFSHEFAAHSVTVLRIRKH
jgi:alpha-N-arabinofuranosidase